MKGDIKDFNQFLRTMLYDDIKNPDTIKKLQDFLKNNLKDIYKDALNLFGVKGYLTFIEFKNELLAGNVDNSFFIFSSLYENYIKDKIIQ